MGEPRRRAAPSSGRARATQKRFCPTTTTVGKAVARRRAPKRHANENVVEDGRHSKPRSRRPPRAHGVPVDARGRGTGGGDRGVPRHHLRRRASPRGGRRARPRRRVRHGPQGNSRQEYGPTGAGHPPLGRGQGRRRPHMHAKPTIRRTLGVLAPNQLPRRATRQADGVPRRRHGPPHLRRAKGARRGPDRFRVVSSLPRPANTSTLNARVPSPLTGPHLARLRGGVRRARLAEFQRRGGGVGKREGTPRRRDGECSGDSSRAQHPGRPREQVLHQPRVRRGEEPWRCRGGGIEVARGCESGRSLANEPGDGV